MPEFSRRKRRSAVVSQVMAWGKQHRRNFSWRRTDSPYEIFVAESLLQRTKADQVEPTYIQFIKRWPTIVSLSRAPPREVRSVVWRLGLGSRARRISTVAREIVRIFGGHIPNTLSALKQLYGKGFGDYMAHALLCFAFGHDVPIVDKNVERILKRVFSLRTRTNGHRDRKLWEFAAELVPKGKAKEYNWSLLDLAALVCTPRNPLCSICPLLHICDYGTQRVCP